MGKLSLVDLKDLYIYVFTNSQIILLIKKRNKGKNPIISKWSALINV